MKNKVVFEPARPGLYKVTVNDKNVPLLLAEHQVIQTIKLLEPFQE